MSSHFTIADIGVVSSEPISVDGEPRRYKLTFLADGGWKLVAIAPDDESKRMLHMLIFEGSEAVRGLKAATKRIEELERLRAGEAERIKRAEERANWLENDRNEIQKRNDALQLKANSWAEQIAATIGQTPDVTGRTPSMVASAVRSSIASLREQLQTDAVDVVRAVVAMAAQWGETPRAGKAELYAESDDGRIRVSYTPPESELAQ